MHEEWEGGITLDRFFCPKASSIMEIGKGNLKFLYM